MSPTAGYQHVDWTRTGDYVETSQNCTPQRAKAVTASFIELRTIIGYSCPQNTGAVHGSARC